MVDYLKQWNLIEDMNDVCVDGSGFVLDVLQGRHAHLYSRLFHSWTSRLKQKDTTPRLIDQLIHNEHGILQSHLLTHGDFIDECPIVQHSTVSHWLFTHLLHGLIDLQLSLK